MPETPPEFVTQLLADAAAGSPEAVGELFTLIYDQLRGLAGGLLAREGDGHTLQPTALVHEAYVKLLQREAVACENRGQFMAVAAQVMRRILVDHARTKKRLKRGGGDSRTPLDEAVAVFDDRAIDLLVLDEALDRLAQRDARKAKVVELRFFAGLGAAETAAALGVPSRTCERDWSMARAWLRKELHG